MSLAEQRLAVEQALNEGRVNMLGEPGKRSACPEFLRRLDEFSPSFRRLGLARACVIPWTGRPDELPACFQWDLTTATAEASEDREAYPDMAAGLEELFTEVREPISEAVLRQIVDKTPTSRYSALIFVLACAWPGGPKPVLIGSPEAPRWLHRELKYSARLSRDEYRAWKEAGWVE